MVAAYPANDFSACATTSAGTVAGIFPRIDNAGVLHPDQPVVRGRGSTGLDRAEQRPDHRPPRPAYPRGADPGPGVALGDPQHLVQTLVQRAVT